MSCNKISIRGIGIFGSGFDDFFLVSVHSLCDIPRIDDEGGEFHNPPIIDTMVCDDDGRVDPAKQLICQRRGFQLKRVFSERGKGRDIGIVIENHGPFFLK